MAEPARGGAKTREVGHLLVTQLEVGKPESIDDVAARASVSIVTVRRAVYWLRDRGAKIEARARQITLAEPWSVKPRAGELVEMLIEARDQGLEEGLRRGQANTLELERIRELICEDLGEEAKGKSAIELVVVLLDRLEQKGDVRG